MLCPSHTLQGKWVSGEDTESYCLSLNKTSISLWQIFFFESTNSTMEETIYPSAGQTGESS